MPANGVALIMTINMMGFFWMMPMLMAGAVSRDWLAPPVLHGPHILHSHPQYRYRA